jgi:hypothetical protein
MAEAKISRSRPLTPSVLCTVPKARLAGVVKPLIFLVRYTRARATGISCSPCQNATRRFLRSSAPPPFLSRLLPASRLLLRAILCTCRRASAVTRWEPSFGRCCTTKTASAATASTAATTTRNSAHLLVLPRGLGQQVRTKRGVFRPRALRDRS